MKKNFIIEIQMQDNLWERSWAFPDAYTYAHGRELIDDMWSKTAIKFRVVRLKPAYRKSAPTQLELRGAKAMIVAAFDHLVRQAMASDDVVSWSANPFMILMDARLAVIRQLEAL